MPPANRDSSELTRRRNAMSMYGWRANVDAANTNGTIVRREQPFFGTLDIITQRKMGGCYCAAQGTYDFNGGGGCGCRN